MKKRYLSVWVWSTVVLTMAVACEKQNPVGPSVALTTPQVVAPTNAQQFKFAEQPVTLTVKNAATVGTSAVTYSFQVASDSGFANLLYTKDGVTGGANGQTSMTISMLPGSQSFFWRARAVSGSVVGPFTPAGGFGIGPQVVLQTPLLTGPGQSQTLTTSTVVLTVNNIGRSGPAGPISYRFDLSGSSSFGSLLFTSTVAEQPGGQTSVTVTTALPNGTYYWRVQASDPSDGIVTGYSAVATFQYQQSTVLFDHPWSGNVELTLRALLASGLAGPDGLNGEAVIAQMNAIGGIYAGAEFQPAHDGGGFPTYGFGWFYVSYVTSGQGAPPAYYQIVEYGAPPYGD
jgi:hypothetical protein